MMKGGDMKRKRSRVSIDDLMERRRGRRGLECPRCGCRHILVVKTRNLAAGGIRRRRECRACHQRFTTLEEPIGPEAAQAERVDLADDRDQ